MYDTAKRSLAFTVATGGLLLSGPGFSPLADAAVLGFGNPTGHTHSSGVARSHAASPTAHLAPHSARRARPLPHSEAVPAPRSGPVPSGAAAVAQVADSGGILSGNTIQIPVNAPILVCGTVVQVLAVHDHTGPTACDTDPAPGTGDGSAATALSNQSGGVLSGNILQAPVNIPIDVCGTSATLLGLGSGTGSTMCAPASDMAGDIAGAMAGAMGGGLDFGASAAAMTLHSGGIGSATVVKTPISVPLLACGTTVMAGAMAGAESNSGSGEPAMCGERSASEGARSAGMSGHSGAMASGIGANVPVGTPIQVGGQPCPPTTPPCPPTTPPCPPTTPPCPPTTPPPHYPPPPPPTTAPPTAPPTTPCPPTTGPPHYPPPPPPTTAPPTMPPTTAPPNYPPPPPPTTAPPTTPPTTAPPHYPPPPPPTTAPPTTPPTTAPPTTPPSTPPTPPVPPHGQLARTGGGEEGAGFALAGGALLAGLGLRIGAKRRSRG